MSSTTNSAADYDRHLTDGIDVREQLAAVATKLRIDHPEISADLRDVLTENIPELGRDRQLLELLRASVESNVSTVYHVMANNISVDSLQPPTAAMEYAARLAQRDIPLYALTRAYYIGQSGLLEVALEEVEQLELPEGAKTEAIRGVMSVIHTYIDWMLQRVTEAYGIEHKRWWSARATSNTSLILKTLRGEVTAPRQFLAETRYDIERQHLALILWADAAAGSEAVQHELDRAVRQLATVLGSTQSPLVTAADPTTIWAWASLPKASLDQRTRLAIDGVMSEHPGIRVTFGGVERGAHGFRRSHEQADRARQLALTDGYYGNAAVIGYSDPRVALAAMLFNDKETAMEFMRKVLGTLAGPDAANAKIRETLRIYYASGRNASYTAEATGVHRNTVRRRVAAFEERLGGTEHIDELEAALALRIHSLFGPGEASGAESA